MLISSPVKDSLSKSILPVSDVSNALISKQFLKVGPKTRIPDFVASVTVKGNRVYIRKNHAFESPITVKRFNVTKWDPSGSTLSETSLTVPNDTAFELVACDVIEFSVAQNHYSLVLCSSTTDSSSSVSMEMTASERLEEAERFNSKLQRKVLELEQRIERMKKKQQGKSFFRP